MAKGVERQLLSGKAISRWLRSRGSLVVWDGHPCSAGGLAGLWRVTGARGRVPTPRREPQIPSASIASAEYLTRAKIPISCLTAVLDGARESVLALWILHATPTLSLRESH